MKAANLLRTFQYTNPPSCPCHGENKSLSRSHRPSSALLFRAQQNLKCSHTTSRISTNSTPNTMSEKEYAFEMAASAIRFGPGVTKEVGMDFKNMGVGKVCVVTDKTVKNLDAMKQAVEGLGREKIEFTIFDKCQVEPKDSS